MSIEKKSKDKFEYSTYNDSVEHDLTFEPKQQYAGLEEKALVRKIDWRILPYLATLYLLFHLDKANIAYARLYGIEDAINLTGDQYSWTLTIFHIGYILMEVPSNVFIKFISPPRWIAFVIMACGLTTMCMAVVMDFTTIMITRFFLGIFESGFFPGVIYLMAMWYTRAEQGFRIAIITSASTFSGAIAGPLSLGVNQLQDTLGLDTWQWIFLIEGAPTLILGLFAWWIIPSSPEKAKWLNPSEQKTLARRLKKSHVELDGKRFNRAQFVDAIKDYKTYLFIFLKIGFVIPTGSISQLMPSIIKDLGFSKESTMLLTVPPYIIALLLKLLISWNSDRTLQRCYHILFGISISVSGFILQAASDNIYVRYFGVNLAYSGAVACLPILLSWSNNNMIGSTKGPTVVAILIMTGSLGSIAGSQFYKKSEAPRYLTSNITNVGFLAMSAMFCLILRFCLARENKKFFEEEEKRGPPSLRYSSDSIISNFRHIL